MKKIIGAIIYAASFIIYLCYVLFNDYVWGTNFTLGMLFTFFAVIYSTIVYMLSSNRKSGEYPVSISMIFVSILYIVATIYVNEKYGLAYKSGEKIVELMSELYFVLIEIGCLMIFVIVISLLVANRIHTNKVNKVINKGNTSKAELISMINRLKSKAQRYDLKVERELNKLSDEIEFSNINESISLRDYDIEIENRLNRIDKELDSTFDSGTNETNQVVIAINYAIDKIKEKNEIINKENKKL